MTSPERGKFSEVFIHNAQSNETSDEKHSLQRWLSLTHAGQEDTASASGISEVLKFTEEPQTQILKHDLEIPPQAKITSKLLSSFPPKMQQLMSSRAKNVSEVRQTTEIPQVTYIWPVIKVEEASRPFWDNFLKYLVTTSQNLTSPEVVIEDVKCSQRAPVKHLAQEELDRNTDRSYPLILKSCNRFVSGILKSLSNNNKDYKSMIPLSSIRPTREQLEIPLFKGNAIVIYHEQIYLLYVLEHEALSPEMEKLGHHTLTRTTTIFLLTCNDIHEVMTKVPYHLLGGQCVVKHNVLRLTTLATPTCQDKTSNATHVPSNRMTTVSHPKQCSSSTGKRYQFLNKTAFPSKEDLKKRNYKEAQQEKDNELRKKFVIFKDLRVHLNRISLPELTEDSGEDSALKWKVTTRKKDQGEEVPKINVSLSKAHRVITSEAKEALPLEPVLLKRTN